MSERHLQVCTKSISPVLCHGPRPEDYMRDAKHMLLCGTCGVILIRTDDDGAVGNFVVLCDNCGAINTDLSQI